MPYEHDAPPPYEPPPEHVTRRRMPEWWYARTLAGFVVGVTLAGGLWLAGVRAPFAAGLGALCMLAGELVAWTWRRSRA